MISKFLKKKFVLNTPNEVSWFLTTETDYTNKKSHVQP